MNWNIDYARAYVAWFTTAAPDDAALLYGDLYTTIVPDTGVRVNFLAGAQDRCIIVKEFH